MVAGEKIPVELLLDDGWRHQARVIDDKVPDAHQRPLVGRTGISQLFLSLACLEQLSPRGEACQKTVKRTFHTLDNHRSGVGGINDTEVHHLIGKRHRVIVHIPLDIDHFQSLQCQIVLIAILFTLRERVADGHHVAMRIPEVVNIRDSDENLLLGEVLRNTLVILLPEGDECQASDVARRIRTHDQGEVAHCQHGKQPDGQERIGDFFQELLHYII